MNDKELDKEAWEIFREYLKFVPLPASVRISEEEDGSFKLFMNLPEARSGSMVLSYMPNIQFVKELLLKEKAVSKNSEIALIQSAMMTFVVILIKNFHEEIEKVFADLLEIPELVTRTVTHMQDAGGNFHKKEMNQKLEEGKRSLDKNLKARMASTKNRVENWMKLPIKPPEPEKDLFAFFIR